jgi:hypothetical protein
MRFLKLRTETKTTQSQEQAQQRKRAAPEVGQAEEGQQHTSIPLEWKPLARFIEAERQVHPAKEYGANFWQRLRPRLERELRRNELVREYMSMTRVRRWVVRMAAAAAIIGMAMALAGQYGKNRDLEKRIDQLEKRLEGSVGR